MTINLENIQKEFPIFVRKISAECDINSAISELDIHYNTTKPHQKIPKNIFLRILAKVRRLIINFPKYFKEV